MLPEIIIALGQKIRSLRQERGLTQEELAKQLGISRPTLIAYEKGKTAPSFDVVATLLTVMGIPSLEVSGYVIYRRATNLASSVSEQFCLNFDEEHIFSDTTLRIRPSREDLIITAIVPFRSVS